MKFGKKFVPIYNGNLYPPFNKLKQLIYFNTPIIIVTMLQTITGKIIFVIGILMICFACIIINIFCSWGLNDVRQRSKIVPVEKEDTNVPLTMNPYNFVKVIDYKIVTTPNKKDIIEIILVKV